jgi:hypothetical protein
MEFVTHVTREQVERLYDWAMGKKGRYPSMSYEDGIIDAIDFFEGNCDVEELIENMED